MSLAVHFVRTTEDLSDGTYQLFPHNSRLMAVGYSYEGGKCTGLYLVPVRRRWPGAFEAIFDFFEKLRNLAPSGPRQLFVLFGKFYEHLLGGLFKFRRDQRLSKVRRLAERLSFDPTQIGDRPFGVLFCKSGKMLGEDGQQYLLRRLPDANNGRVVFHTGGPLKKRVQLSGIKPLREPQGNDDQGGSPS